MNISHDRSYIAPTSEKWIARGYAKPDFDSLRIQYVYTQEQQAECRSITPQGLALDAQSRNAVMAPIMAAIAEKFVCCQYKDSLTPYRSECWDLFFWCNDFSNTLHGCGLSGRDYSYFTLTFNENQAAEKRAETCQQLLEFMEQHFHDNPNLDVVVQHCVRFDEERLHQDAEKMMRYLDGHTYMFNGKEGRLLLKNGVLLFRPKYSKRKFYRMTDTEILDLCWELGLISEGESTCSKSTGNLSMPTTLNYEKYGTVHPMQLQITSYLDGNLAIQMVTWAEGYPEPWASLTVNLDGVRGRDCAFIDTNGDPDFPVWLIRNGLAIPTGITQRSGFCEYPEYRFRADRLREFDPDGYEEYIITQKKRVGA